MKYSGSYARLMLLYTSYSPRLQLCTLLVFLVRLQQDGACYLYLKQYFVLAKTSLATFGENCFYSKIRCFEVWQMRQFANFSCRSRLNISRSLNSTSGCHSNSTLCEIISKLELAKLDLAHHPPW